jgi:hypothetical protein
MKIQIWYLQLSKFIGDLLFFFQIIVNYKRILWETHNYILECARRSRGWSQTSRTTARKCQAHLSDGSCAAATVATNKELLRIFVELKVFFLKNPWLSTGQTNKQITHYMEPSLECSVCFVRGPPLLFRFARTQPNPNPFTPKEDNHHHHHQTDTKDII